MKSKKPQPILSQLLQIIGWCIAGLGVLTCVASLIQFLRNGDNISFGAMIMAAVITLFWTAIFLGLAQVITAVCETAENSRDIAARLVIQNQHTAEIAKAMQWIVDNLPK